MISAATSSANFSLAATRHIVKDLFAPKPWIYWTDFLTSMTLGSLCFLVVRRQVFASPIVQALVFLASAVCFYRAVLFTHEMVHLRDNKFLTFRVVWNLLCGIPFLIPSFTYYTHVDHHMRSHFGTQRDGEYVSFGTGRPSKILLYLLQPFYLPVAAVIRFLLLTPISWFVPGVRTSAHRHASSMVMDPKFIRPLPSRKALRIFRWQELACFLVTLIVAVRFVRGTMPFGFLVQSYLTSVAILMMNNIRTLGAHRYISDGHEGTFVDQLLDSVNYPEPSLLTPLWAPVGLRYHALHHLCPTLPYHALKEAHERLMAQLPADSPYRRTNSPSLWASLRQLWKTAAQSTVPKPSALPLPPGPNRGFSPRASMEVSDA